MSKQQAKVVIVGAGVAGISAACRLFEEGFKNITILEAKDRIGGRIHTVDFGKCRNNFNQISPWFRDSCARIKYSIKNRK